VEAVTASAIERVQLEQYVPTRADVFELTRLALPVALAQLGLMTMGLVDTVMVGRVSPVALAAVAIGHLYFFGIAVIGMGILFSLDPVISQAVGADDALGIARGVQRGVVLGAGLSAVAMGLMLPVEPVLTLFRQPPEVIPVASRYVYGLLPAVFPFYVFVVLRQSLQAMGRVRAIVFAVVAANLLNAGLDWVFIYGHLGAPALGAVGSAYVTSVARWFTMLALLALAWPSLAPAIRPLRRDALAAGPLWRLLQVGGPVGAQQWLEVGVFATAGLLMGSMGAIPLAGHQVALQLAALTFMVPLGVAQATSILVGQAVGRGHAHEARRATGAGMLTGVGFMALTAVMFLTVPDLLARIFSDDPPVIAAAGLLLPIAGVFQIFDGMQVVAAGALRGVGDTRMPMVLNLVGFWLLGLPVSVALGFGFEWGPRGVWWGLALGIGAVAVLLTSRVRSRLGRTLSRLVIDEDKSVP
jgi:MATE family multidrug resistance protein